MKKIAVILTAFIILLSLVACGGKAEPAKTTVVGTWEYESDGYVYTFNEDGTGNYDAAGTVMKFTYTEDGSTLSILFEGNTVPTELPYKIDGSKITITDSFGTDAVFNRK